MNDKCDSFNADRQENLMSQANTKTLSEAQGDLSVGDGDPPWLLNVISSLQGYEDANEKALIAYLYIIMYESGFYFLDGPRHETISYDVRVMRCLSNPQILLDHMKKETSEYVTVFSHNLIYPKLIKVVSYRLATNVITKDIIFAINFLLPDNDQVKAHILPINKYISLENGKVFFNADTRSELTVSLKNALYLLKGDLTNDETCHQHHILALPLHILQKLCFYLDPRSFVNITATCKSLWEAFSEDEALWKYYSMKKFPGMHKMKNETWKEHFKYQIMKCIRMRNNILSLNETLWQQQASRPPPWYPSFCLQLNYN